MPTNVLGTDADRGGGGMSTADLNSVLWRERELLDLLLFFLETEHLMLAAGRTRWLAHTSAEIEQTTASLREIEILRAMEADQVAAELGLDMNPALSALARAADEPWSTILDDQREALLELTAQINDKASVNRVLLAEGQRSTREALLALSPSDADDASAIVTGLRSRIGNRST
jgi:hypothetical protein